MNSAFRSHFFVCIIAASLAFLANGFTVRLSVSEDNARVLLQRSSPRHEKERCRPRHKESCFVLSSTTTRTNPAMTSSTEIPTSSDLENCRQKRIIVVGGGIGGLAVASRLAAAPAGRVNNNINVTILEKQSVVGGRCGSWTDEYGYRHERGPSLLLLPHIYERLFQEVAQCSAAEYGLDYVRCVPAYRAIFDDDDYIDVGYPLDHAEYSTMISKMNMLEPEGASRWHDYMSACEAFLDCGLPNFIEERLDLQSFPNFIFQALRNYGKAWPLKPHSDVLDAIFTSAKMKALASFQDLYVGLEPFRNGKDVAGGVLTTSAPAVFGLLSAIELHPTNAKCGVYAPIGGFDAVTQSIESLARRSGVTIQCNTSVTSVRPDGVWTSTGDFHPADLVIVNADLPYAEASLVHNKDADHRTAVYDWEDKYKFSSGVVAFHWSISQKLDMLATHTVFLATQQGNNAARQSWNTLRSNAKFQEPFNFYVHCPSKTDPSACPEGCETIMVLVPCQTLLRDKSLATLPREEALREYRRQFDDTAIETMRAAVLKRMRCVADNLENAIISETVDTPATYADNYNLGAGTPFGLSHGLAQLSLFRPSQPSSATDAILPNVLYCGASTRPGNGVPLVLVGAERVAQQAIKQLAITTAGKLDV
jgi:phytoene desaturase